MFLLCVANSKKLRERMKFRNVSAHSLFPRLRGPFISSFPSLEILFVCLFVYLFSTQIILILILTHAWQIILLMNVYAIILLDYKSGKEVYMEASGLMKLGLPQEAIIGER